jgi:hypothetical protein
MIKPSTAAYDWDEARAHIELMGHANVGLTQIAAFRPGNFDERNFLGVFEPGNYGVAIDLLRQLQRQDSTLSFYVGINPLVDAALPYAANQMRPGSDILAYGRVPKWISGKHVARRVNVLLDLDPPIRTYDDPNLRAFYERTREGEMLQAAFRIRPLEGKHKLIVVLSNLPLSGLPPTEMMSLFDLKVRLGLEQPSTRTRILRVQEQLRHELGREPSHAEIADRMGCDRSLVTRQMA